ncbi:MAG TPA: CoA transferase, partial [Solirubrobacteraceae bacterium]
VRQADAVVENFAAGVMDRLGLGGEVLRAENPRLVYGCGTGFGLSGPYRDLPAMDLTIQAMSGIMNATGYPDLPPVKAGPAVCDFLSGVHLCAGILGALLHRERTGQGQLVEVAMLEASVVALVSALGSVMDGTAATVPERTGNRHPALSMAPYNVYPTTDGYVAIFTASERHWHSVAKVLGREDLLSNPAFGSTPARAARGAEIDAMVEAWTRGRTKGEVMKILTEAHVPCAPVQKAHEVIDDPHLAARGLWVEVEHPRRGKTKVPISSIRLHGSAPSEVTRVAPMLGQDTDRVLSELLGLGAEELGALHATGVIEPVTSSQP